MLSPTQPNTSAYRPTQAARGPVPIRFGRNDPKLTEGFKKQLGGYDEAIIGLHDFSKNPDDPYHNYNFAVRYTEWTRRAQAHFEKITKVLTPQALESMKKKEQLGLVEEASDMLFEAATLAALEKGVFKNKTVAHWNKDFLPPSNQEARDAKPFEEFLKQIDQEIPKEKAQKVEKQMGWEPAKAHQLLLLMGAKFTLMRRKDINYDLWDNNKKLLLDEGEELREAFPWYSPKRLQIWLLAHAFTSIPRLPLSFLQSQLVRIVSSKLKKPVTSNDLMENVFAKQARRQEFDYQNPHLSANKERKQALKGVEVVTEAAITQNALEGHPRTIPTF
jgi:hypothetical protein